MIKYFFKTQIHYILHGWRDCRVPGGNRCPGSSSSSFDLAVGLGVGERMGVLLRGPLFSPTEGAQSSFVLTRHGALSP